MKSFTPTASRRLPGVESKRAATAELTGAWVCSSWSSLSIFTSIVFHSCPIFGGFATVQKLRSFLVAWPRTSRPAQFLKHHVCYRRWCGDFWVGSSIALRTTFSCHRQKQGRDLRLALSIKPSDLAVSTFGVPYNL